MILALLKDLRKKHGQEFEFHASQTGNYFNLGKAFTLFLQLYGEYFKATNTGLDSKSEFKDIYDCYNEL
jgi:hypothetical protein